MSTLNSLLMILVPIGVAFAAGHLLFQRRGSGAVAATSAYGTVIMGRSGRSSASS